MKTRENAEEAHRLERECARSPYWMKTTTAATADKQEQHAAMDHSGVKTTRIGWQDRWSNWVEEQNRKNAQRASKPDNIVVAKIAGEFGVSHMYVTLRHANAIDYVVVLCAGLLVWCYYGQSYVDRSTA